MKEQLELHAGSLDSTEAVVAAAPSLPAGDQPWSDVIIVQYVTMWGT
jgi:hypothetical protein